METQVEKAGKQFRIRMMAPREQLHVLRRVLPVVTPIIEPAMRLLEEGVPEEGDKDDPEFKAKNEAARAKAWAELVQMLGPVTEVLSMLPDHHLDYVMDKCLLFVDLKGTTGSWHPIYVLQPNKTAIRMYNDIPLSLELPLVIEVMKANLSGFFELLSDESVSSLSAPKPTPG